MRTLFYIKVTIVDSEHDKPSFVIPPPPPMPPPQQQNSIPTVNSNLSTRLFTQTNIDTSDYCTIKEAKQETGTSSLNNSLKMSPNSLKNFQRKSVAFQDDPPSEFNIEVKARRKSLTNYISDKAALVTNVHTRFFNSKSTNNLVKSDVELKKVKKDSKNLRSISSSDYSRLNRSSKQFFEPEPDYWDSPSEGNNIDKEIPLKIDNDEKILHVGLDGSPDLELNKKSSNKAVSLAQIIVQSISASNSNKSSLSSSSSKVSKPNKTESSIEKLIMPVTDIISKSPSNASKIAVFFNSQQDSPIIPLVDYDKSSTPTKHDLLHHSSSNYSSNVYNSLENQSPDKSSRKNDFLQSFQTGGSSSAVYSEEFEISYSQTQATKNQSIPPAPPMPPPPPPMPLFGFNNMNVSNKNSENSKSLHTSSNPIHKSISHQGAISVDSETLLTARQKLKIQTSNASSSESNSTSDKENEKSNGDEKKKQNDYLLKEIQNHRLYNTKKDYVLDFLDRGNDKKSNKTKEISANQIVTTTQTNKSCIIVVNNNTTTTNNSNHKSATNSNVFNRSLSSLNFNKNLESANDDLVSKETNEIPNHPHHSAISQSNSSPSSEIKQPSPVNYERFPYTRNPKQQNHNHNNKYSSSYMAINPVSQTNQRATSLTPATSRNNLPTYLQKQLKRDTSSEQPAFKTNSINNKSMSIHNLNQDLEGQDSLSKTVLKISINNGQIDSPRYGQSKTMMPNKKMSSSISDLLSNYEQQINNNQANKFNYNMMPNKSQVNNYL